MRPLELRLRNFRSYFGDETVIDFRGRRLVGIVGPIVRQQRIPLGELAGLSNQLANLGLLEL